MWRLSLVFFIGLNAFFIYGQKTCSCADYEKNKAVINTFINENNLNETTLKHRFPNLFIPSNEICLEKGYELLAEIFIQKKLLDSADKYLALSSYFLAKNKCSETGFYDFYILNLQSAFEKNDYNNAINFGHKALNIVESENNNLKKAQIISQFTRIYIRLQQYETVLENSRKLLGLIETLPPSVQKAILLESAAQGYNIAVQYKRAMRYPELKNRYSDDELINMYEIEATSDKLIDTFKNTVYAYKNLALDYKNRPLLIKTYRHLQNLELLYGNKAQALVYIDSSLTYCKRGEDDQSLFAGYGDKSDIYFSLKDYNAALQYADSCLFYAKKTNNPLSIANAYLTIASIAEKTNTWQKAYFAEREVKLIMDTVNQIERNKAVSEIEKKYNQAKNEKTIKELAQQKQIYLLLAITGLLGLIVFGFFLRQQHLKHKQRVLETEQRLNRARMNPHFFFNALTSLQSFALRENNGKSLAINIAKFSNIMRETLESTYKEYITIEQEMDYLNQYLEIQQIRFPKKFAYVIFADNDMDVENLVIPSMIVQPFVENAIEHGFAGIRYEGVVEIEFKHKNDEIEIEIKDNGNGLAVSQKANEHISRATQIIKDRIYLLNTKLKSNARFTIAGLEKGVSVHIFLPVIYKDESLNY